LSLGRNGVMRKIDDPNFPDAKTILNKFIEESSEEEDE